MIVRKMNPQLNIIVQIDNASPHGIQTHRMLTQYCDVNNLMIEYTTQPSQSPDL